MRIAIVTMEVKGGHCAENFAYIKEQIEQAKKDHADMIVFPQSCINGVYGGEHFHTVRGKLYDCSERRACGAECV